MCLLIVCSFCFEDRKLWLEKEKRSKRVDKKVNCFAVNNKQLVGPLSFLLYLLHISRKSKEKKTNIKCWKGNENWFATILSMNTEHWTQMRKIILIMIRYVTFLWPQKKINSIVTRKLPSLHIFISSSFSLSSSNLKIERYQRQL